MNPMTMKVWIESLYNQTIKEAIGKAGKDFETYYRQREISLFESDLDRAIKILNNKKQD